MSGGAYPGDDRKSDRIVDVSSVAELQSAMGNLQAGDTIVLADGFYNLTSTLYVNGRDNVTIRGNSGCDQVVLLGETRLRSVSAWNGQLERWQRPPRHLEQLPSYRDRPSH